MKLYLKKLKTTLLYRNLLNNYFILAFFVVLLLITINYLIGLIVLIPYIVYIYRKNKSFFKILFLIAIAVIIMFLIFEKITTKKTITQIEGTVINIEEKETYNLLVIRKGLTKVYVYDQNKTSFLIGYKIKASGEALETAGERVPGEFNYEEYLKHQKIVAIISSKEVELIEKSYSLGSLKSIFIKYINLYDQDSRMYLKGLILGNDDEFNDSLKDAIKDNGVSHLFAISGLHIGLLVMIIKKLCMKIKLKEKAITIITVTLLSLYLILTSFAPSICRSALMYFLYIINKNLKLGLSSLDIISIIFIGLIIINPYYMYSLGFCLSFMVATLIIIISPLFKDKNNYYQILLISLIAQIVTFPIIINLNSEMNIFTPAINVIYISFVSAFLLPLTFLTLVFFPLSYIYKYIVIIFSKATIFIADIFTFNFSYPKVDIYFYILYYLLLFLVAYFYFNKKVKTILLSLLLSVLILVDLKIFIIPETKVYFLDVYNGDAIFINDTCSNCKAIIDTGDGENKAVTSFLKRLGVKKLNLLILSHNHDDHNGEAENILKEINVERVITSTYDNSKFSLLSKTKKVKSGDTIKCGLLDIMVLHPDQNYTDMNDNSLVLYTKIGDKSFLFLGDATKKVEDKLPSLDVDILKVGHHGSTTSTSPSFIKRIKPEIAIIQTTRIKMFNFPRKETIKTLENQNIQIYRTDLNYTIIYHYYLKKGIIYSLK